MLGVNVYSCKNHQCRSIDVMLDSFGKAMPIGDKPLHSITWSTAVDAEFIRGAVKLFVSSYLLGLSAQHAAFSNHAPRRQPYPRHRVPSHWRTGLV